MTAISITPGYPNYSDTDGSALNDGYVYIGLEYQNPITAPTGAFWDQDFQIPADQPLRTSGGYIVRDGSPAAVYTGAAYSILVQNKNLVTVYNAPSAVITNVTNTVEDITQYQGAHATDPLARNDGTPLQVGDLYFNTSINELKVWTGSVWAATSPGNVAVQNFTGTGSQTAFTLSAAPIAENNTQIYIDGVYQQKDTYAVAGATINFSTAPPNLSTIEVVSFSIASLGTVDSSNVSYNQGGTGAVNQSVQSKLQESVSVKDFGATGDGVTDDTAAIQSAITHCQLTAKSLYFPQGIYAIGSTITLSGTAVSFYGSLFSRPQSGSQLAPTTIRWTGGASSMFDLQSSFWRFFYIGFENTGTATDCFLATTTQHLVFDGCSWVTRPGASRWSRAAIRAEGNELGYSVWKNCEIVNPAPKFLDYDGLGTSNGVTPIWFNNNVIESNTDGAMTLIYLKDENFDLVSFTENTVNQQSNDELTIIDCTDSPLSTVLYSAVIERNEFDVVSSISADRLFKFENSQNITFNGNTGALGGSVTAVCDLTNSKVSSFQGNFWSSLAGTFFNADATSTVNCGANTASQTNTRGIVNDSASASGVVPVTFGATCRIRGHLNDGRSTVYRIDATSASAFNIIISTPLDSVDPSHMERGSIVTIQIKNTSGGALGSITTGSNIKLAGGAMPSPANAFSQAVTMVWDGTNMTEISRTSADIAN